VVVAEANDPVHSKHIIRRTFSPDEADFVDGEGEWSPVGLQPFQEFLELFSASDLTNAEVRVETARKAPDVITLGGDGPDGFVQADQGVLRLRFQPYGVPGAAVIEKVEILQRQLHGRYLEAGLLQGWHYLVERIPRPEWVQ
jgi:hypothetical protein